MMKMLSFKITTDHFLLCLFLSLLWGLAETQITDPSATSTGTNATEAETTTTAAATTPVTTLPTTQPPPPNAADFKQVDQSETSVTLQWKRVDSSYSYLLKFVGGAEPVPASNQDPVTWTVHNLNDTTQYDFTLFTVREDVQSSGVNTTAYTAPPNAEGFQKVDQDETSITLQWMKVDKVLNYKVVFNEREEDFPTSEEEPMKRTISHLNNTTQYTFTLFSLYENIPSSGVNTTAYTAPLNTDDFRQLDQSETSITLQWDKVDGVSKYIIEQIGGEPEEVPASEEDPVTHTISHLNNTTQYSFTLYSVYENIPSSGVNTTAYTAPPNAEDFQKVDEDETSITLQWMKVDKVLNYKLVFNERGITVPAPQSDVVKHRVGDLNTTTQYDFTLFSVYENVTSSGVNTTAYTAPLDTNVFTSVDQSETNITLQWEKVDDVLNYRLMFNDSLIPVNASEGQQNQTHTVSGLTSGTKYNFTLYSLFHDVRSRGVKLSAATAPRNTQEFKPVDQNETSITLQWDKVDEILSYMLKFNDEEINVTASERQQTLTHTVLDLTSGTKYDFTLYSLFDNVRSSGVKLSAATAPGNVNNVTVLKQNESSITLMWDKVNNISTYFLQYDNNGSSTKVTGDTFSPEASVTHEVSLLNAGTNYSFTLITLFEKVNSTGFSFNAVTVPPMVTMVDVPVRSVTSIALTWQDVKKDWDYLLHMNGEYVDPPPERSQGVVSYLITSLQPGTEYHFNVTTVFSGLKSAAYKNFTVTRIDCSSATWRVTTSSIHGVIQGLFSRATATNGSQPHLSRQEGGNVSFTGLYPGATYEVSLVYETQSRMYPQCETPVILTATPPYLTAKCEYWGSGYSVLIVWDKPYGTWTAVEVNVSTGTERVHPPEDQLQLSGFLPARTYQVSVVAVSRTVKNSEPYVFSCLTDPRGVIAGSVFAVLLFVLLVLAVLLVLKRPDIISRKKSFISGSRKPKNKCKAISVAKFPAHFHQLGLDENRGFTEEYESLASIGTEQTRRAASLPENKARNRFNNVLPYDWCRVKLTSSPDGTSDYINASYMPGYSSSREYIATQGPLPTTVADFWRMIWEQKVKGIVMVTNCTEGGRVKCEQYWPSDSEPCPHGELLVTLRSEQQEPDWTLREFSVKHRNNSEERPVKHFHFTAWPDHGVPQGTRVLIQFRALVRRHINTEADGAPTVVHCSAGVGRTGTIISLDVLLQQLERETTVGIKGFVHKMRLSRPYMVQTESQYVFLHQCMMDCLQQNHNSEENIYENADMIYANATALRQLRNTHA